MTNITNFLNEHAAYIWDTTDLHHKESTIGKAGLQCENILRAANKPKLPIIINLLLPQPFNIQRGAGYKML